MDLSLFVVPYDMAVHGYGMGRGPVHLLHQGLAGALAREAGGSLHAETVEVPSEPPPAEIRTAFELARRLAPRVATTIDQGRLPVVLTGQCSSALGVVAGLAGRDPGVVWFDAHGDFNTPETTASGFLDGTALALVLGHCWQRLAASVPGFRPVPEAQVVLAGARDLDPPEEERLAASAVHRLRPAEVPGRVGETVRTAASGRGLYLHLDLDVLDPAAGSVNRFAAPGGVSVDDLVAAVTAVGRAGRIRAVTLSAYEPSLDTDGRVAAAVFAVARAAVRAAVA
jgi:arginase